MPTAPTSRGHRDWFDKGGTMIQPTTNRGALLLATATFTVACAAIVAMMVLLSDHTEYAMFLPLFAPAGLASWAIYRPGTDTKPFGLTRGRGGQDHRPLLLVVFTLAALVWCLALLT